MPETIVVDRLAARRFLVRRTGLGRTAGQPWPEPEPAPPAGNGKAAPPQDAVPDAARAATLRAVRAMEYVQVDPVQVVGRNHDLVLAARVPGYRPEALDRLLYGERLLVEAIANERSIVPVEDYPLFRLRFARYENTYRPRLADLEPVLEEVLAKLRADGPLSSLDFEDDRRLSGWWNLDGQADTRVVRQALEWLWHFGRVVVTRRDAGRRVFDLAERVYGIGDKPPGAALPKGARAPLTEDELRALREGLARKYVRAAGLSAPGRSHFGWFKRPVAERRAVAASLVEAGELVPVVVEGVKTPYFVPAAEAGDLATAGAWDPAPVIRFLPPLDNLIWDRDRTLELFGFDYAWEVYTPPAKRKYGPYTCPILRGDVLVGRVEARLERRKPASGGKREGEGDPGGGGCLVVRGVWWEGEPLPPTEFRGALEEWAAACGATDVVGH